MEEPQDIAELGGYSGTEDKPREGHNSGLIRDKCRAGVPHQPGEEGQGAGAQTATSKNRNRTWIITSIPVYCQLKSIPLYNDPNYTE